MAEKLKREYDVVVLKVQVEEAPRGEPGISFTLQCKVDGRLSEVLHWRSSTHELGVSLQRERASLEELAAAGNLPGQLLNELRGWLDAETTPDRPLWVHLVKPYGLLRFLPWERILGTALQRPILMLPDFIFPRPREVESVLDVVLCGSAPLGQEEGSVAMALQTTAARILDAASRRTRVHVFVDAALTGLLRAAWEAEGRLNGQILVHEPAAAAQYVVEDLSSRVVDRVGTLRSPWLLWIREALRGHSVDVVHFANHGHLSRDQGALLFAQSPLERTQRYLAGPVGATELQTFLTQIGAWSTVFTAVEYNNSEAGIRALADDIAQSRPGPMMMHTMALDPSGQALQEGYGFLYGRERRPPPASPALLIYCQPYLDVNAAPAFQAKSTRSGGRRDAALPELARNRAQRVEVERSGEPSSLDSHFGADDNVATWVGSTERFVEQVQLQYQQFARDETLPLKLHQANAAIVNETLRRIRDAVARTAGGPGTPGSLPAELPADEPDAPGSRGEDG